MGNPLQKGKQGLSIAGVFFSGVQSAQRGAAFMALENNCLYSLQHK